MLYTNIYNYEPDQIKVWPFLKSTEEKYWKKFFFDIIGIKILLQEYYYVHLLFYWKNLWDMFTCKSI